MKIFTRHNLKSPQIDMLHGRLAGKIIQFAIPLIATGIMQQSFNSIDVAVIGLYCSPQSLAAVGSNGMIISLIVNLFMGLSVGANVVIAHYIGRNDREGIKRSVSTVALLSLMCGVAITLIGVLASKPILEAISTPEDVVDLATQYLTIYFLGMPALIFFNFGAAILRSLGDTQRPFFCLVAGGVINIGLNFLLVVQFDMDVAGVAIATVVSNLVAALLLYRILRRMEEPYRLHPRHLRLHSVELKKMMMIGMPAGLQGIVFAFSNVFIVSGINTFGALGSAGSAAAINYEYYCYFVMMAFSSAAVAFTSQNYAAGDKSRCNTIFRQCMEMGMFATMALNLLIYWQRELFTGFFTSDPAVMEYAYVRLHEVLMLQWIAATYEISGACMRGLGYSLTPALLTVFGTCVVRLIWVYLFHHTELITGFDGLLSVYPITWLLTGAMVLTAYFIVRRKAYASIRN